MYKKVEIKVTAAGEVGLDDLNPLQGNLKTLSDERFDKLKHEIITDGFSFAFSIWENPSDAKLYILDGHQRFETLSRMRSQGFSIPLLPVNYVEADDLKHAMRKLLAAASQYGEVQEDGLAEFLKKASINVDEFIQSFNFNEINTDQLIKEINAEPNFDKVVSNALPYEHGEVINIEGTQEDKDKEHQNDQSDKIPKVIEEFILAVYCKNENQLKDLYERLMSEDFECKIIT